MNTNINCNICNQSCNKLDVTHDNGSVQPNYEFAEIEADWGVLSHKPYTRYSARVCEECFDKHLVPLIQFERINLDDLNQCFDQPLEG